MGNLCWLCWGMWGNCMVGLLGIRPILISPHPNHPQIQIQIQIQYQYTKPIATNYTFKDQLSS